MRLRYDKEAEDNLKNSKWYLNPEDINNFIENKQHIEIEIGMGKGDFIVQKAQFNPHIFFIGIEKYPTVQQYVLKKIDKLNLNNVYISSFDSIQISQFIKDNSIDKIYLNFSDPWPKSRHYKRRLTYVDFLKQYHQILKPNKFIEFKSDQKDLYNFTREQVNNSNYFKIIESSLDLHRFYKNNFLTEYEKRFSGMGHKIFYLKLKKN